MVLSVTPENSGKSRALLLMVGSALCFGIMAFTAKVATARLGGAQVAAIRFAIGLLPFFLVREWRSAGLRFQRTDLLLCRGFFGGLAVLFYFLAIQHIPVGVATLFNYCAPIYSGVLSMLFLKERISAKVLIPLPVALAGIYFVVHSDPSATAVPALVKWQLIGIASGICSGAAVTAIRAARRTESSWSVYGSFCLIGLLLTAPVAAMQWQTPTVHEWGSLLATGFFAMFAQLLMTFSLRWIDAMTVGVISQVAVVISMVLGACFLSDSLTPRALMGSAMTLAGVIGVMLVSATTPQSDSGFEAVPEQ